MVLYAVLLLSLLSRVDTPLSLSLSFQLSVVSLSFRICSLVFHWVSFLRFRQHYEGLSWNKAPQHQMFILFCSVCHPALSFSLLVVVSFASLSSFYVLFTLSLPLCSVTHAPLHHFTVLPPLPPRLFNLVLLCLLSIKKPHSYLIEGPCLLVHRGSIGHLSPGSRFRLFWGHFVVGHFHISS